MASSTSRTRIDFDATRIGTPLERTTRSSALWRNAVRSMDATGPDTPATAAVRARQYEAAFRHGSAVCVVPPGSAASRSMLMESGSFARESFSLDDTGWRAA